MRIRLAIVTGAAALLTTGTGVAAYAVVGHETISPTVAGNDLPIDDNHSPVVTVRTAEPGDDRGRTVEPGDDRGRTVEPGDDRGGAVEPGDDRGGAVEPGGDRTTGVDDGARHGAATPTSATTPDDHGGRSGGSGGHGGHGGDDGSGHS